MRWLTTAHRNPAVLSILWQHSSILQWCSIAHLNTCLPILAFGNCTALDLPPRHSSSRHSTWHPMVAHCAPLWPAMTKALFSRAPLRLSHALTFQKSPTKWFRRSYLEPFSMKIGARAILKEPLAPLEAIKEEPCQTHPKGTFGRAPASSSLKSTPNQPNAQNAN